MIVSANATNTATAAASAAMTIATTAMETATAAHDDAKTATQMFDNLTKQMVDNLTVNTTIAETTLKHPTPAKLQDFVMSALSTPETKLGQLFGFFSFHS